MDFKTHPLQAQSFKALKPKAVKSVNSVKALSLSIGDRLGDTSGRNTMFYLKCAWRLSESQIFNILDRSANAGSPVGYFLAAASREMRDNANKGGMHARQT